MSELLQEPRLLEVWERPRLPGVPEVEEFLSNLIARSPSPFPLETARVPSPCPSGKDEPERVGVTKIRNGIFLGSETDVQGLKSKQSLQSLGITGVLDVRLESKGKPEPYYCDECNGNGPVTYKWIGIDEPLSEAEAKAEQIPRLETHFAEAFDFIESRRQNGQAVLVHCAMGVCRSPSIIIAFLMQTERLTFKEAFAEVHRKRNIVRPNDYFIIQLLQFEQSLREQGVLKPAKARF